jgi:hypothetical protein
MVSRLAPVLEEAAALAEEVYINDSLYILLSHSIYKLLSE